MRKSKFYIGMKIDSFEVIEKVGRRLQSNGSSVAQWLVRCGSCNNERTISAGHIRPNQRLTCICPGNGQRLTIQHGLVDSREYYTWKLMKQRCYSHIDGRDASNYRDRGIVVCSRWLTGEHGKHPFMCFLEDMGVKPENSYLDRVDVNGNYEPSNCRWVDGSLSGYNQRRKSHNTSGRTGVCWSKSHNKWDAYISVQCKDIFLGHFSSFEEAVAIREAAELKYYGYLKE